MAPPSPQEWRAKKDVIVRLYLSDHFTLSRIVEIMKQSYNFEATERMYKARLKQWETRKCRNRATSKAIIQIKRDHGDLGKPTESLTGSWLMNSQKILSEFSLPSDIVSFPRPHLLTSGSGGLRLYQPPTTPSGYRIIGTIFRNTEIYLESFRTPQSLRSLVGLERGLESQKACMDLCDSACWYLSKGKTRRGFEFLNQFAEAFRSMTKLHPSLVTLPYQLLDEFSSIPDQNIANEMLRYISTMLTLQLGATHPISVICRHLRGLFHGAGDELLQPGMELICKRSLEILGQTNPHTLDVQQVHNFILMSKGHFSDAEVQVRHLLTDCEPSLGINHKAVLQFRNQLALALWKQNEFAQMEQIACLNLQNANFSCDRPQVKDEFVFSLQHLHLALLAQGKVKLAEFLLRGALRLSIDIHKEAHFTTENLLGQLRKVLLDQGAKDEADRVSLMNTCELRKSYLAEDNWDEGRARIWASREGEDVSKYYPYRHTMYCGCAFGPREICCVGNREMAFCLDCSDHSGWFHGEQESHRHFSHVPSSPGPIQLLDAETKMTRDHSGFPSLDNVQPQSLETPDEKDDHLHTFSTIQQALIESSLASSGESMHGNSPERSTGRVESELVEEDEELLVYLAHHRLLRKLMQEFYSLWSPTFKEIPQCSTGDSSSRTSGNASPPPPRGQSNTATNRKRRIGDRNSPPPEGDGNREWKKQNMGPNPGLEDQCRRLACPFHKNDPSKYGIAHLPYRACAGPGFSNMTRLRQHLSRTHKESPHCVRCWETFSDRDSLSNHHRSETPCEILQPRPIEGISEVKAALIANSYRKNVGTVENWSAVYEILFPGAPVPSPYYDDIESRSDTITPQTASSYDRTSYEAFIQRRLPPLVEAIIRRAIQATTDDILERLKPVVEEACRSARLTLNQEWDARSPLSPGVQRQMPALEAGSPSPFSGQSHFTMPVFPPPAITPFPPLEPLPDCNSSSRVPPYHQISPEDTNATTLQTLEEDLGFQPPLPESQISDSSHIAQSQFEFLCICGSSSYTMSNDGSQSTHSLQSSLTPWGSVQPTSVNGLNPVSVNPQERRVTKCHTCHGWRFIS